MVGVLTAAVLSSGYLASSKVAVGTTVGGGQQ
jgi:hypothetical protein